MTKTAKWLGLGLVASLALNLFVLGAWAGRIAHDRDRPQTERVTLGGMTDSLSPEGRTLVRQSMRANRKEALPIFKQLNQARERANAALDAEPYDAAAYEAALRDVRTYSELAQALLHTALIDVVAKLSPEDRHHLAQESKRLLAAGRRMTPRRPINPPPPSQEPGPPGDAK